MKQESRDWEREIEETCLRLTPPLLLASYDSWRYPESDSDQHQSQVASRIKIVEQWVQEEIPKLLKKLYSFLEVERLDDLKQDSLNRIRACIVVAASVYVNPRKDADGSSEAEIDRDPWSNTNNRLLSLRILQHPLLSSVRKEASTVAQLDNSLISYLLGDYLRPIFRSTPSSSINASTGRITKANFNLSQGTTVMSGGASMQDETMWKGGDLDASNRTDVLGEKVLFDVKDGNDILRKRNRALGCFNVLYICCSSISAAQESGTDLWQDNWPLILPPLLALLEDSSPLYRLLGSRILSTTLLKSNSTTFLVGTLLLRTGVATLFRQKLQANLTYISTKLSAALLQSSAEALILLTQATTMDVLSSLQFNTNIVQDEGKERFEQWSKLMEEGVIRVWAYAPTLVSSSDDVFLLDDETTAKDDDFGSNKEASDVINASIEVLDRLAQPSLLGLGMVRYLDLALEFLSAQMVGLEMRLDRHKGEEQASRLSLDREICSSKAMESLIIVCREAPGVRTWSCRCLDAAARCWVLLQDQRDRRQVTILFSHLLGIVQALSRAYPNLMSQQFQKLLDLDRNAFSSLVEIKAS